MVSAAHTTQSIESATGTLQEELHRLEAQKRALERELAAVVAHLGSVQKALRALQDVLRPGPVQVSEGAAPSVKAEKRPAEPKQDAATVGGTYGRLTEQILEYFATTGGAGVRARDVAAALGRDTDSGSINAVRSTLDRLVGTDRLRRAGRGLYRAAG
ncbi:hypothetical protein [Streptomyces sp. NPDC016845]|uniref:hypothetical protein n=1 Tax=Streptomyces sp. NPDC016845 TaxID=3364972 RepID=UPI0037B93D97